MLQTASTFLKKSPFDPIVNNRVKMVYDEVGFEAFNYISNYSDLRNSGTHLISSSNDFLSDNSFKAQCHNVINLKPIEIKIETNYFIKFINEKLKSEGLFIGCFKIDVNKNYKFYKNKIAGEEAIINKNPQITVLKESKINDSISNSNKILKLKLNLFGRFSYFGFEIISEKLVGHFNYFVAKKIKEPSGNPLPSASPIIKLNRIGKSGKIISIYKLRTMYPYSEYLQDYIFKKNQLESGGKFNNDFRILKFGNLLRKYWIDELPMIINLIKGDVKLFGVRPLSEQYFNLYPQAFKEFRIKFKPGLIPPYYVDMPNSFEAILDSEMKYLTKFQESPRLTDFKYLLKALFNIIIKCKRSK